MVVDVPCETNGMLPRHFSCFCLFCCRHRKRTKPRMQFVQFASSRVLWWATVNSPAHTPSVKNRRQRPLNDPVRVRDIHLLSLFTDIFLRLKYPFPDSMTCISAAPRKSSAPRSFCSCEYTCQARLPTNQPSRIRKYRPFSPQTRPFSPSTPSPHQHPNHHPQSIPCHIRTKGISPRQSPFHKTSSSHPSPSPNPYVRSTHHVTFFHP